MTTTTPGAGTTPAPATHWRCSQCPPRLQVWRRAPDPMRALQRHYREMHTPPRKEAA